MEVTLTWAEVEIAVAAGCKRRLLALHDGRPDAYGFRESDPWGTDIESAASEMAVAKALGLYWIPYARRPQEIPADVGDDVQVRRRKKIGYNLLLHPRDPDEHIYVLVYGQIPTFTLEGWTRGATGKARPLSDPFNTGRPAFWIPAEELAPIDDLLAMYR